MIDYELNKYVKFKKIQYKRIDIGFFYISIFSLIVWSQYIALLIVKH